MKLKYLFTAILSSALLFAGCEKEEPVGSLDNISLSQTYVSIPEAGGTVTVTLNATEDWTFVLTEKGKDKDGKEVDVPTIPDWLTVTPTSGSDGETTLSFSADAVSGGHEVALKITAGTNTQQVIVRQGEIAAVSATVAEALAGTDGKTYKIKGTVTDIYNTDYGNYYLVDNTGKITIYGTLDAKGNQKNFSSLKIENGDVIEVSGPRSTYNGSPQLKDVTVLSITKSLIKVLTPALEEPVAKTGGSIEVKVAHKGEGGARVSIPEADAAWISYISAEFSKGVPSKIVPNPADTTTFKFDIRANEAGIRTSEISFTSGTTTVKNILVQAGSRIADDAKDVDAATINAAPDGPAKYRITGYISEMINTTYGNYHVADATGSVYVYGTLDADGKQKNFGSFGISEGYIITVVGPKTSYKGDPQLKNVSIEYFRKVTEVTVKDFLSKEVKDNVYYRLSGTVGDLKVDDKSGHFSLTDTKSKGVKVEVNGLLAGWGGPKKEFEKLGIKEGDTITIVGVRADYNGSAQVGSAFLVSHTAAK